MEIKGYVDHIIYRKAENGYTVFILVSEGDEITCVGSLPQIDQGDHLLLEGEEAVHPLYGSQIKVISYRVIAPDDEESMERYLGSGAIKGVGPALAARMVKKFKKDTFRIIEEEPERLTEIKGISERIARQICEQMEEKKGMREVMVYLAGYGITGTMAIRIYDTYGPRTVAVLEENPYRLAEDISGIGFKMADEIAGKIGIKTDSDYRIIYYGAGYTSLNDVANYLLAFGEVPKNSNYNKNSNGRRQSVSEWGEYGRCNTGAFSGDTSKYPYEPLIPTVSINRFVETDFGTLGGYSNINEVTGTAYHQEIYNDGTRIERGAARFVFTSDARITSIDDRFVFYTYNHYNDFQEFLNFNNGWGIRFGNVSAGNPYCSSSKDYYASNINPVGLYPETIKKSISNIK